MSEKFGEGLVLRHCKRRASQEVVPVGPDTGELNVVVGTTVTAGIMFSPLSYSSSREQGELTLTLDVRHSERRDDEKERKKNVGSKHRA